MESVEDFFLTPAEWMKRRREWPDPLRIGKGATVPRSYAQWQGRIGFFNALYRLEPKTSRVLATDQALALVRRISEAYRASDNWSDGNMTDEDIEAYISAPKSLDVEAAEAERDVFIRQWQIDYTLHDEWIGDYVAATMRAAYAAWLSGRQVYDAPLHYAPDGEGPNVHDGLSAGSSGSTISLAGRVFTYVPEHKQVRVPVYLQDLEIPTHELLDESGREVGEYEDDGWIGWFDCRTENVEDTAERIIDEVIRPRIIGALNGKVRDDLEYNDAMPSPKPRKSAAAYDWTVRYQVLGESRNKIAASVGRDRTHVGREIQRIADLIDLTLRPERGGQPSKRG